MDHTVDELDEILARAERALDQRDKSLRRLAEPGTLDEYAFAAVQAFAQDLAYTVLQWQAFFHVLYLLSQWERLGRQPEPNLAPEEEVS